MTTEYAIYALRRKPQDERGRTAHVAALEALGRAGVPAWEIEDDIMRPLTAGELAIIEASRKEAARG
jgi:hypothetical protein